MIESNINNILIVIAHPDDLELMAGGSVLKWSRNGCKVHVLTFTNGEWKSPEGKVLRNKQNCKIEEKKASEFLNYSYENLNQKAFNVLFSDKNVVEVLKRIEKYKIDTLIFPFKNDIHPDHKAVSKIALAASRKVPNVLQGQINYYLDSFFKPNIFVDITDTWEDKITGLKLFESQWSNDWYEFIDATSVYYGKIIGVKRAEGFLSSKFKL